MDWQWRAAPARPFDGAQDERPHTGDGFTLRQRRTFSTAHLRPVSGHGNGPPRADRFGSLGGGVVGVARGLG